EEALPLVARIEAAGGPIKNAALSALFESRRCGAPPTARLLGGRLARELAKEGAAPSRRELGRLLGGPPGPPPGSAPLGGADARPGPRPGPWRPGVRRGDATPTSARPRPPAQPSPAANRRRRSA